MNADTSLANPVLLPKMRFSGQRIGIPIVLLLLCLLSYGPGLRGLGFYWDDWPGFYVARSLGHQDLRDYLSSDRPAVSWLFSCTAPLLGSSPLTAHVFALILRWAIALAAWWIFLGVWPGRRFEAAAVSCLIAVYPGFSLHSIAWIHAQGVYIPLLFCFCSLAAMVWSLRNPRWVGPLSLVGILSAASGMVLVEYFIGLELFRPVLLWPMLDKIQDRRKRIRRIFSICLPYLAVTVVVVGWRLLFFKSSRAATDQGQLARAFFSHPLLQTFQRIHHLITDVIQAGLMSWTSAFSASLFTSQSSFVWIAGLLVLTAGACVAAASLNDLRDDPHVPKIPGAWSWAAQATLMGAIGMLMGGLPVWAANRHIVLGELSDRYSLPLMLGACLFATGLIRMTIRTRHQQIFLIALLAGLGAAYQYRTAEKYSRDWSQQKDLLWQLSWRAPGIKSGTPILIDDESAISPKSDYAISVPLNLTYVRGGASARLSYWFFELGSIQPEIKAALAGGTTLKGQARSLYFAGAPSQALVVSYAPPGCLVVIDPSRDNAPTTVGAHFRSLSHLDRIIANPGTSAHPPREIFGPEPAHGWCYYFERADLARQTEDWAQVIRLADEVRARRLEPADPVEWMPFLEGYLHVRRMEDAGVLRKKMSDTLVLSPQALDTITISKTNLQVNRAIEYNR